MPLTRRTALSLLCAPLARARSKPNIVLFLADDLGSADLSSYGAPDISTPRIDAIAREGVRFTQCYANGPECSPTRSALLTGRYQHRVGGLECAIGVGDVGRYDEAVWLQQRGELGLPPSELTLPMLLKRSGYETGMFGKWHLGYPRKFWPGQHGFDESFGILGGNADYFKHTEGDGRPVLFHNGRLAGRRGYLTDVFADEAEAWLKKRSGARPFFLYVPFNAPHTPIQHPEEFDPEHGTAPVKQKNRAVYAAMVERVDRRVGGLIERLPENTIVLFLSDNGGDPNGSNGRLRGRKSSLWEGGIRIPCLMRWPGVIAPGTTTTQVALTMDLTATLLAAAGLSSPRRLDGLDLLPVLAGRRRPFPRTVFWRFRRAENIRKAVRHGDWKLVNDNGREELHHLAGDEYEQRDVLTHQPARAAALRRQLAAWEQEVRAPRLAGFRANSN